MNLSTTTILKKVPSYLWVFLVIGGCASSANLEPANETPQASQEDAAVNMVNGVSMTVQADDWPGDPGVPSEVTPVQVTIHNEGNEPLALKYENFALISPDGRSYSALPPFEVEGEVDKYELAPRYEIIDPTFEYDGFYVAPYYGALYNDIGVYDDFAYYNVAYYDNQYAYWENTNLPTAVMLARALPEGIIKPGGYIKGFLYFEKVDPDKVSKVYFRADLQNPGLGLIFGEITIPFKVKE